MEDLNYLILVRHGQSEWNAKNLFTGWKDPDLTDQGRNEAEKGTITNSINIPFQDIDSRYEELLTFKETPIVLVCALGRNAGLTGEKLSKKGFTNLTVLKGGISSWQQDNMPLVKP